MNPFFEGLFFHRHVKNFMIQDYSTIFDTHSKSLHILDNT